MLMTKVSNYDLFNRTPNFNYKKMNHNLDVTKLENPFVQIVWEDFAQNFTQEKIKSVRHYFQKKYNTTNVNVITKSKNNDTITLTIDLIESISNSQFYESEKNLLKMYSILNIILSILENTISNSQSVCNSINGQLKGLTITEGGKTYKEP